MGLCKLSEETQPLGIHQVRGNAAWGWGTLPFAFSGNACFIVVPDQKVHDVLFSKCIVLLGFIRVLVKI